MAYNKKAVLEGNTEAIRVVLRLEKERREATEAEKVLLRGYQGFGGLKCVLNRCDNPDDLRYWSASEQNLFAPTQRLKQMIYRDAVDANTAKRYWESIKASVLTSFDAWTLPQVWEPLPKPLPNKQAWSMLWKKTC